MKFIRFFAAILIVVSGFIFPTFACHRDDCPHSTTDTGVHWQRSLRFSFGEQEFNLLKNHQAMSRRAAEREKEEGIDFLNIALGNIQFVYEDGHSFKTSPPFEIRVLDETEVNNPFFSNLSVGQPTRYPYVKFLKRELTEGKFKTAEKFIDFLSNIGISNYTQEIEKLNNAKNEIIIEFSKSTGKRKRKKSDEEKIEIYNNFKNNLENNKIKSAKINLQEIKSQYSLEDELNENIKTYFKTYKHLKRKIKGDIETFIKNSQCQLMARRLFGLDTWEQKIANLEKQHSPQTYIQLIQSLVEEGQSALQEEEDVLNSTPLNSAWRRLRAPVRDFLPTIYLPFNRKQMLIELAANTEVSHLQHSEQLLIHSVNSNFPYIQEELTHFLTRKKIINTKIFGAFFNLFSTRDMCERCAVCLTIDHAHTHGIASKLKEFIHTFNKEDSIGDPFVVYTISSRIPYGTPIGSDRINSREELKSIDAYSDQERGRNVKGLSEAHISIQSALYPYSCGEGEYTEDEIISLNNSLMIDDSIMEQ
ncbi:MAG: hypothetical protein K2W92_03010 [Alphaproteobacteria bacterium]|nr:hypothetical protein [Alphaproteobacteria bacterium]